LKDDSCRAKLLIFKRLLGLEARRRARIGINRIKLISISLMSKRKEEEKEKSRTTIRSVS